MPVVKLCMFSIQCVSYFVHKVFCRVKKLEPFHNASVLFGYYIYLSAATDYETLFVNQ